MGLSSSLPRSFRNQLFDTYDGAETAAGKGRTFEATEMSSTTVSKATPKRAQKDSGLPGSSAYDNPMYDGQADVPDLPAHFQNF